MADLEARIGQLERTVEALLARGGIPADLATRETADPGQQRFHHREEEEEEL